MNHSSDIYIYHNRYKSTVLNFFVGFREIENREK